MAQTRTVPTPGVAGSQFEGSQEARDFIERLRAFVRDELEPLADAHGLTHEKGAERPLLDEVWKRSRELGFYGMTLPEELGGKGFSVVDHVLIKECIYASGSPLAPHVLGELTEQVRSSDPSQRDQGARIGDDDHPPRVSPPRRARRSRSTSSAE